MFENVGHDNEVETLIAERDLIGQRTALDLREAARLRESDGTLVGIEREEVAASSEHRKIPAGAASRLQNRGVVGQAQPIENAIDDGATRGEPPMRVLDLRHARVQARIHSALVPLFLEAPAIAH